jgi:predicted metal-dependent HD superfamily phosphohydrolase
MKFAKVKKFILDKLKKELKPNLYYHGVHHTIDVLEASKRIAKMENINGTELTLLKTAALFHDIGFLIKYKSNEQESAKIAKEILPDFDYKSNEINRICNMVLSTKIPQSPKTLLDKILCDADLDYLGRDDFFIVGQKLHREWNEYGIKCSLKQWYMQQVDFITNHKYFTESEISLRYNKKMLHLSQIKELLNIK